MFNVSDIHNRPIHNWLHSTNFHLTCLWKKNGIYKNKAKICSMRCFYKIMNEWVNAVLDQVSIVSISWRKHIRFWWDNGNISCELEQHTLFDFQMRIKNLDLDQVLVHCSNSLHIDMALHSDIWSWPSQAFSVHIP